MSIKDFEQIKQLGKGAFSVVLLAKRLQDNKIYAIKQVSIQNLNEKEKKNSLNEIRILASVKHPNIISYYECFYDNREKLISIVLEYADNGDLETVITNRAKANNHFKESEIWSIFLQMIMGLKCLHDKKIMHRDLKSANIFLMKNGRCKLGDLNVSKLVEKNLVYTQTGTPYYASPEVWRDQPYDYKSDIWSVGCILYEMCSLSLPFEGKNFNVVYNNVIRGEFFPIPNFYSRELSTVVSMLLQVNPAKRPSAGEVLNWGVVKEKLSALGLKYNTPYLEQREKNSNPMMGTIKFKNDDDIGLALPKKKNYDSEGKIKKKFSINRSNVMPLNKEQKVNALLQNYNSASNRKKSSRKKSFDMPSQKISPKKSLVSNDSFKKMTPLKKNNSLSSLISGKKSRRGNIDNNVESYVIRCRNLPLVKGVKSSRAKTPCKIIPNFRIKPIETSLLKERQATVNTSCTTGVIQDTPNKVIDNTHRKEQSCVVPSSAQRPPRPLTSKRNIDCQDPFKKMLTNPIKIVESKTMRKFPNGMQKVKIRYLDSNNE